MKKKHTGLEFWLNEDHHHLVAGKTYKIVEGASTGFCEYHAMFVGQMVYRNNPCWENSPFCFIAVDSLPWWNYSEHAQEYGWDDGWKSEVLEFSLMFPNFNTLLATNEESCVTVYDDEGNEVWPHYECPDGNHKWGMDKTYASHKYCQECGAARYE